MATTSSSVEAGTSLFLVIPVVLIVSAAILLDRATIYETLLHRCQIQIWLWLGLLLVTTSSSSTEWHDSSNHQQTDDSSMKEIFTPTMIYLTWAHLAIFFNLVGIIIIVEGRRSISGTMPTLLRIVPISCWWSIVAGAVVHSWTKFTSATFLSLWKLSIVTFLATLLGTWFLRILANRRVSTTNLQQGMPVTTTTTTTTAPPIGGGIVARLCGMAPLAANTTTTTTDFRKRSSWLDERQWYTWTRIQTMQWFSQQLQGEEEETGRVLAILSKQCITGVVLESLDLSQLVALKVPFGPACKLSNAIVVGLLERYPKPRIINGVLQQRTRQIIRASNDCLDLHDHEYNNATSSSSTIEQRLQSSSPAMVEEPPTVLNDGSQGTMSQQPPRGPDGSHHERQQQIYPNESGIPGGGGGMSEEQHEKLNQVMKDRFGLELPKLRATDFLAVQKGLKNKKAKMDQGPKYDEMSHPFMDTNPISRANNYYYANNGTQPVMPLPSRPPPSHSSVENKTISPLQSSTAGIPDHILKGMPPDLQEIAKRRPDLVATIWKQQQQRLSSKSNAGLSKQRYNNNTGLAALPERNIEEQNRADAMDEEFDSDNEDETTSLIHRDEIPGRYKAVDKSMYPSIL